MPGPNEVRIAVSAWGVNFIDVLATVGLHPVITEPRFVPGHEIAGVVEQVGAQVTDIAPGDRVAALVGDGGYARHVITPSYLVMPLPSAFSFHHGATVYGTSSAPDKLRWLREVGVQFPINYKERDFADAVRDLTQSAGGDVIIDSLSGDAITRGFSVLKNGGRFIEMPAGAALQVPSLDPAALFLKNQRFMGVNIAHLMSEPVRLVSTRSRLADLLGAGIIKPVIGHRVPLTSLPEAHQILRERRNFGKVVLTP